LLLAKNCVDNSSQKFVIVCAKETTWIDKPMKCKINDLWRFRVPTLYFHIPYSPKIVQQYAKVLPRKAYNKKTIGTEIFYAECNSLQSVVITLGVECCMQSACPLVLDKREQHSWN